MASVYVAVQTALERQVALKVMNPALAADPDFTVRFLREGPIAAKLNDPQIVTIYDTGVEETHYYLAMEYLPGGTLKQKIKRGLPIEQALTIAKMLGSALGYAHSRNVLHRDFKPQNILFRDNGTPVLTDFGIAKAVGGNTQMTAPGTSIGSPMYMSPEQAHGRVLDERSDIYSLGVVFFEMLTGKTPYQSKDSFALALMHINEPIPRLPAEFAVFQPIIEKLLAKQPEDRFKIAEQFVEAVKQAERAYYSSQQVAQPTTEITQITQRISPPVATLPVDDDEHPTVPTLTSPKRGYLWGLSISAIAVVAALSLGYFLTLPPNVGAMLSAAREFQQQNKFQDSLHEIDRGLALSPANIELKSLRKAVTAQLEQRDNATEHLAKAQQLLDEDRAQDALLEAKAGLEAVPDHQQLLAVEAEAEQSIEDQRLRDEARVTEERVTELLAKAKTAFERGESTTPPYEQASELYLAVLELDSGNEEALAGLQRIADRFERMVSDSRESMPMQLTLEYIERGLKVLPGHEGLVALRDQLQEESERLEQAQQAQAVAQDLLRDGEFDAARSEVDRGLELVPDYQGLLDLTQQIQLARQESATERMVATSVERAEQLRQSGQFEQALRAVEQAQEQAPEHPELVRLQQSLSEDLASLARQLEIDDHLATASTLEQAGELDKAMDALVLGLELAPDDEQLQALKQLIIIKQDKSAKIAELLRRAAIQLQSRQLTTPDGDNAYQSFDQVLRLDPDNAEAQDGFTAIAKEYAVLAERDLNANRLEKSQEFVALGLGIVPEQAELLAIKGWFEAHELFESGQIDQALQQIRAGLQTLPEQARLRELEQQLRQAQAEVERDTRVAELESQAQEMKQLGDVAGALERVEQALELNTDYGELEALRSELQDELEAQQALQRASSLFAQGKAKESLEIIERGLDALPGQAELSALRQQVVAELKHRQQLHGYESEAQSLAERGELAAAMIIIEQGLAMKQDHSGLLLLQSRILAEQAWQTERGALIEEVESLRAKGDLDAARAVLKKASERRPDDEIIKSLTSALNGDFGTQGKTEGQKANLLRELLKDVESLVAAGELQQAKNLVDDALRQEPQNLALLDLQAKLQDPAIADLPTAAVEDGQGHNGAGAEDEAGAPAIEQLLALAEQHYEELRLSTPAGKNARDVYRQVLVQDPGNAQAKQGLARLASTYQRWARNNIDRGDLNKADRNVSRGLAISPGNSALQRLQNEVAELIARRDRPPVAVQQPSTLDRVDPCDVDVSSYACWCKRYGLFCNRMQ